MPQYTSNENWETAKTLTDAALASPISPQGVDRIQEHFTTLNKRIQGVKRGMFARENIQTLKDSIHALSPQWQLLQDKNFNWQSKSVSQEA